jgi:hypothetical protein
MLYQVCYSLQRYLDQVDRLVGRYGPRSTIYLSTDDARLVEQVRHSPRHGKMGILLQANLVRDQVVEDHSAGATYNSDNAAGEVGGE